MFYALIMTPYVLVFPQIYRTCDFVDTSNCQLENPHFANLDMTVDVICTIDIVIKFFKVSGENRNFWSISRSYMSSTLLVDLIATLPGLFKGPSADLSIYSLKLFRLVHFQRLNGPLVYFMTWALSNQSKNERADKISFFSLLLYVFYLVHCLACIWISVGMQTNCDDETAKVNKYGLCNSSWIYANDFDKDDLLTLYAFAFYYIFEVITTVGYGDYCGTTTNEHVYLLFLEFCSISLFAMLMGSVSSIAGSDTIDDMIENKYDALYMWIKKIEKSAPIG
jgi:hypothetical protein